MAAPSASMPKVGEPAGKCVCVCVAAVSCWCPDDNFSFPLAGTFSFYSLPISPSFSSSSSPLLKSYILNQLRVSWGWGWWCQLLVIHLADN